MDGATSTQSTGQANIQSNNTQLTTSAAPPTATNSLAAPTSNNSNNNTNINANNNNSNTNSETDNNANTFVPLTRARMRENLDNQDVIDINNLEDIQNTKEVAALMARLFDRKLTEEEFAVFNDLIGDNLLIFNAYFTIRNAILEQWFKNVQVELTKEQAREAINEDQLTELPPDLIDKLFNKIYWYLVRVGLINFGMIESQQGSNRRPKLAQANRRAPTMSSDFYKPPLKANTNPVGRVIVIGAGLSGLMAARQLQRFGMEVIVIEARNRVGGRVHTYRKGNFLADLGPSSINGVIGNPVVVLGKQLDLCVTELKQKIPLFEKKVDKNGTSICYRVDFLLERAVEREYNKIMEGTRVLKNNYKIETHRDQPFAVGVAVDWVMKLQEKNIKDDQIKYLESIEQLYERLIQSANKKLEKSRIIKKLHGQLCSVKDSTDIGNHKDHGSINTFNRRSLTRDLDLAIKEYKLLVKQEKEINKKILELTKSPPSDTYLSLSDRRLLDWHFAELEYALGCPINKLAIYYEDDEQIFDGSHWMLLHGFNTIVDAMKVGLDIHLGTAVKKISVHKNGCRILTYQPDHAYGPYTEWTADAVLCTLPLGTLQDSIIPSQQAAASSMKHEGLKTTQKGYQPVIFSPPLPRWKCQSINKLGCGNLNKIVLSFEKAFWDHSLHLFGVVNHKAVSRGEFFLFWHHGRTPTLTGLISGEAADIIEKLSDAEVLERCLGVLRSIYGVQSVPMPKDYVVTRWRKDPWARGAWSYLQVGSKGSDYDACADPVILTQNGDSFEETRPFEGVEPKIIRSANTEDVPRLFFAGEHTTKTHFASAHGAIITGVREAARIANIYLGCPYDDDDEKPGVVLSV